MNPPNNPLETPPEETPVATPPSLPASPFAPTSLAPQAAHPKRFRWRLLLLTLGYIQFACIAVLIAWLAFAFTIPLIGLLLFVAYIPYVMPILAGVAVANAVAVTFYLFKGRPSEKNRIIAILSLIVSLGLLLYCSSQLYQYFVVLPQHVKGGTSSIRQAQEQRDQAYATDNTQPEITKEEAIALLQGCKLKGFYYTQETKVEHGTSSASSKTGIVLTKLNGEPVRINIADRLISELVPIAREAQKTCQNPQFWHDGSYEELKDGKWYFNNKVVNSTQTGKSKEEVLGFMKSCKATYFVGYTNMSLVKDANTRVWLDKAEQSSTGLELSDTNATAYVFASKAMTSELQNTAREFRKACYSTKKLYIAIDDWIETEYPAGTWTKIKQ